MGRTSRKLDGHYRTEKTLVSVWFGTFPDEGTCQRYFHQEYADADDFPACEFWRDLGIRWFDHDFEESSGYVGDPVPVTKLVARHWSYADSFRKPLLAACRDKRIESANIVVLLYEFDYPEEAGYSSPHLTFIGVFPYEAREV